MTLSLFTKRVVGSWSELVADKYTFWYCSIFSPLLPKSVRISEFLQNSDLVTVRNLLFVVHKISNLAVKTE